MNDKRQLFKTKKIKAGSREQNTIDTVMKKKNKKIDLEKALELRVVHKMSYKKIAEQFNVSGTAVSKALKKYQNVLVDKTAIRAYQKLKVDILDNAELKLLNDILKKSKRDKASISALTSALSVIANMGRLEKGLSTSNVAYADMSQSLEELKKKREELEKELE
jgi:transcriptional regulator with XRE-family HTH domain